MIPALAVVSHYGGRTAEALQTSLEIALKRVFKDYTSPIEKTAEYFGFVSHLDYRPNPASDVLRLVQMLEDIEGPQVRVLSLSRAELYKTRIQKEGYDVDFHIVGYPREYSAYAVVKGYCVAKSVFCRSREAALKALAGELGVSL